MRWLLLFFLWTMEGKTLLGHFYRHNTQWAFLGRFCYDTDGGTVKMRAVPDPKYPSQMFVFYDNGEFNFWSHYGKKTSCRHKLRGSHARHIKLSNPLINRTQELPIASQFQIAHPYWPTPDPDKAFPEYTVNRRGARWWYLVVANCEGENIGIFDYEIVFKNGGGYFTQHFSGNEHGIFESLIVALIFVILILLLVGYSYWKQITKFNQYDGLTLWLFVAIVITFISIVIQIVHKAQYAKDGIGFLEADEFTNFLDLVPQTMLVWMFINVSKGWMISSHPIRDKRSSLEAIFIYFWCLVAIVWWAFESYDPAIEDYIFDSPPGVVLVVIHLIMVLWFISELQVTWNRDQGIAPAKRNLYISFGILGTLWFLCVPTVLMVAVLLPAKYVVYGKKIVVILETFSLLVTYWTLWVMFLRNTQKRYQDVNTEMQVLAKDTAYVEHEQDADDSDSSETNI